MNKIAPACPSRAILLVDNGSSRPESTLSLRRIASQLAVRIGQPVQPVSLLHAECIPAAQLGGQPAEILEAALHRLLYDGVRELIILPLFFGRSAALTQFIPEMVSRLVAQRGPVELTIAPELCPLPPGEPLLVEILADQVGATMQAAGIIPQRVVLVDHGSPLPQVTAVRHWLAGRLRLRFSAQTELIEAVMERRPGPEYDFNGPLLEEILERLAAQDAQIPIVLAMLFISPGRHAGPHGDIAQICARIKARHPSLPILISPLVGEHPTLIEILAQRFAAL
ncbi:cobalamin biosynthesis protein CbiX [Caldichromatium japonicum]|uniref:Cobalamin biosynthesis protein CbiX n=1 Tax=Caldichromatium japonicum TaxID=2699430 RepID=A0A6G7VDL7_9GAMM|nr:CbiX/SirB N-terminal domain-containing protein [Caldichromatium japonicum]QIK38000.1 cobalamin biosynthesis protein CbiX [Caldichromatium japonicum]